MEKKMVWLHSAKKTAFFCTVFCLSMPVVITFNIMWNITRSFWFFVLTVRFYYLDFVKTNKIRNVLDTNRNQGIVHTLLHVEGLCDVNIIKNAFLEYVIERRNRKGNLLYPKLRLGLSRTWGYYAWRRDASEFDIKNHVILGDSKYLGALATEDNIQFFVSKIVSKYLPEKFPPWQIVAIPIIANDGTAASSYYLLVRIHHVILSEEKDFRLRDILLVTFPTSDSIPLTEPNTLGRPVTFSDLLPTVVQIPKWRNELTSIKCDYVIKYGKLTFDAIAELFHLLHMIVIVPRQIYEEMFETDGADSHKLQYLTLSGRKVMSWSKKIDFSDIAKICEKHEITPNEVFFSSTFAALYTFLEKSKSENFSVFAKSVDRDYIFDKSKYSDDLTNSILVTYPLKPHAEAKLENIKKCFDEPQQNRLPLFALYIATQIRQEVLTLILPQFCLRILFNYLSRKFPISITTMTKNNGQDILSTLWNDEIIDIIYFTPPQSNTSLSLTIQRFGEHIRCGVLMDANFAPHQKQLAQDFGEQIKNFWL